LVKAVIVVRTISFPQQCDNQVTNYKGVIENYYEVIATGLDKEDVLFDCSGACFFRPLGLNVLAALLYDVLRRRPPKVLFNAPGNSLVKKYLEDQGFYSEFRIDGNVVRSIPRGTSVGLKHFDGINYTYFESVASWLNRNSMLSPHVIENAVKPPLIELLNNVFDHSESPIGCYICAQAYPHENRLIFSVVDLGVGFLKTLSVSYPRLKTNIEAIILAVQEGTSGKPRGKNAGAGLSVISGWLKHYSGELEIISMDGVWSQKQDGSCSHRTLPFLFPGSCINLIFYNKGILAAPDFLEEEETRYG